MSYRLYVVLFLRASDKECIFVWASSCFVCILGWARPSYRLGGLLFCLHTVAGKAVLSFERDVGKTILPFGEAFLITRAWVL